MARPYDGPLGEEATVAERPPPFRRVTDFEHLILFVELLDGDKRYAVAVDVSVVCA